jgi:hypothetical protein
MNERMSFLKGLRLKWTALFALFTTIAIALLFPQQLGVLLFKINVLTMAAVGAYLLDIGLFPYARPSEEHPHPYWQFRRVAMIIGVMIAAALAL